jgi:hypothetical protein
VTSDSNVEHTLHRIIDHERERAIHARIELEELRNRMEELGKQTALISNAFLELLAILEHHQIEVTGEILSPMTYAIIMNLRMRLEG